MNMNRRSFIQYLSALGVSLAAAETFFDSQAAAQTSVPTISGVSGRVVVIGGGMGGASAAKFARLRGGTGVQVTLVEPNATYTSNIMSNLVLTGQRTLSSLSYSYSTLTSAYGIKVVQARATSVDVANRRVLLSNGTTLAYDRLILAPGIVFDAIPGLTLADYDTRFPHAWQAGAQTTLLRNQLTAMSAGGTFVMTIPAAPYRCPPGPYERAAVVADWLKRNKPGSKVIVLDANPKIMAEPVAFTEAFNVIHAGVVQYVPNAVIDHIDPATKTVYTSAGNFRADVLNPIPPHRAGKIAQDTGLVTVGGRWVGVDVLSYQSVAAPNVHVIGDAIGTTQPKSGHIANAEAKVAVDAITRLFGAKPLNQNPVTSSACYSPITASTASWLTAVYKYDPATQTMKVNQIGEAPSIDSKNYSMMSTWFNTLMADTFK